MSEIWDPSAEMDTYEDSSLESRLVDDLADLATLEREAAIIRARQRNVDNFIKGVQEGLPEDVKVYTYTGLPMTEVFQRDETGVYTSAATLFTGGTHKPFLGNTIERRNNQLLVINDELGLAIPTAIIVGRTDMDINPDDLDILVDDFDAYLPELRRQLALGNKALFIDSLINPYE